MTDYATLHTAYCAGVNEALKGSGYTISCTRKGYHQVLNESGVIIAQIANIEFVRKGATDSERDVTVKFDHPDEWTDSTPLSLSQIKGYQFRTLLFSGETSEWVEVVK